MKKFTFLSSRLLILISGATLSAFSLSSCGSILGAMSGGKRPAYVVNAPKDVVVKLDGKEMDINLEVFAATGFSGTTITYYTSAIKLPYKKPVVLEVSSASLGKSGKLDLEPKNSSGIFWTNFLFAPIVGHIIDGVTDNNKTLKPEYIDIASVLNNVPFKDWPSQGKLKRQEKRKIKKG